MPSAITAGTRTETQAVASIFAYWRWDGQVSQPQTHISKRKPLSLLWTKKLMTRSLTHKVTILTREDMSTYLGSLMAYKLPFNFTSPVLYTLIFDFAPLYQLAAWAS